MAIYLILPFIFLVFSQCQNSDFLPFPRLKSLKLILIKWLYEMLDVIFLTKIYSTKQFLTRNISEKWYFPHLFETKLCVLILITLKYFNAMKPWSYEAMNPYIPTSPTNTTPIFKAISPIFKDIWKEIAIKIWYGHWSAITNFKISLIPSTISK